VVKHVLFSAAYAEIKRIAVGGLRRELPPKLIRVLPVFACIALAIYLVIDKMMVYQQSQSVSAMSTTSGCSQSE